MKITVFTSNQPRHLALIESLASIADEVFAVQEAVTVFPGKVSDFYAKSEIMQEYFSHVVAAEYEVFGRPRFSPENIRHLVLKRDDLRLLDLNVLKPALKSDFYIVFGSSFIRGDLCDFLIRHNAYNIHMGASPFYRGTSCNFWALYDDRPSYVAGTVHLLSQGMDSGPILFHALPKAREATPFAIGMLAVESTIVGLIEYLKNGSLKDLEPLPQDKQQEIRYSRNEDFTDEVAAAYLARFPNPGEMKAKLEKRELTKFWHPYIPD